MEAATTASSSFRSTLALPRIQTPSPTVSELKEVPNMAPAPISTFDSSNDASSPGHKVSSNLGSIKIIDFGPKGGVFHARVRLDIQEIPRLKIYFDNAPTRTVMISAGENIVELRGNVPSKLIGTVKVSVQVFCDEEIVDSAPLGVFNMKDLMNEAATSLSPALGKRSKEPEPEEDVRPLKRSSVLSGPQWGHGSTPVGQTCGQGDVQTPVNIRIEGDLASMATNWSQEEYGAHRRLVRFWRQQNGANLRVSFAPIRQDEYVNGATVISCIHCQENDECYFTSVDIINLLESLIGTHFSIEEKNRVRRNVEGFKPTTVSKNSKEHNEFFNLIMSFPQPRPRNIEKDVKVFPWGALMRAIEKIAGKFVYSSATGRIIEEKTTQFGYARSPRLSQTSYFTSPPNFRSSVFESQSPSYSSSISSSSSVSSSPDTPLLTPPLSCSGSSQRNPIVVEDRDSASDTSHFSKDTFSISDPKKIVPFASTDVACSSSSSVDLLFTLDQSSDMSCFLGMPIPDPSAHVPSADDFSLRSPASAHASSPSTESFTEEDFSAFLGSLNTQTDLSDWLNSIILPETVSSSTAEKGLLVLSPLESSFTPPQAFGDFSVDQSTQQLFLESEDLSSWNFTNLLC